MILVRVDTDRGFYARSDFIYSDVPYLAGVTTEQYNKRYRQTFASPELKKMIEKIREFPQSRHYCLSRLM